MNKKRLFSLLTLAIMVVCAFACVNADSGEQEFVDEISTYITADTMWGAVIPVVKIIAFVFTFAFAYRIVKKVLKKGSQGKFGM